MTYELLTQFGAISPTSGGSQPKKGNLLSIVKVQIVLYEKTLFNSSLPNTTSEFIFRTPYRTTSLPIVRKTNRLTLNLPNSRSFPNTTHEYSFSIPLNKRPFSLSLKHSTGVWGITI